VFQDGSEEYPVRSSPDGASVRRSAHPLAREVFSQFPRPHTTHYRRARVCRATARLAQGGGHAALTPRNARPDLPAPRRALGDTRPTGRDVLQREKCSPTPGRRGPGEAAERRAHATLAGRRGGRHRPSTRGGRTEANGRESLASIFQISPVYPQTVSRTLELSLQSSFQLSLTVLVRYRSCGHI
jgi:hypothetical protein